MVEYEVVHTMLLNTRWSNTRWSTQGGPYKEVQYEHMVVDAIDGRREFGLLEEEADSLGSTTFGLCLRKPSIKEHVPQTSNLSKAIVCRWADFQVNSNLTKGLSVKLQRQII